MAEEAQEVTVTNTGQPTVVVLTPVSDSYEVAQGARVRPPTIETVLISPVID